MPPAPRRPLPFRCWHTCSFSSLTPEIQLLAAEGHCEGALRRRHTSYFSPMALIQVRADGSAHSRGRGEQAMLLWSCVLLTRLVGHGVRAGAGTRRFAGPCWLTGRRRSQGVCPLTSGWPFLEFEWKESVQSLCPTAPWTLEGPGALMTDLQPFGAPAHAARWQWAEAPRFSGPHLGCLPTARISTATLPSPPSPPLGDAFHEDRSGRA